MMFGIFGMIGELIVKLIRGNIEAFDWMEFAIWAVVTICGAIKEGRK
jgi:hypothetical protein